MKVVDTPYVLLASTTVTAINTPTRAAEGLGGAYVVVLLVAGLLLILLGLALSRRSSRTSRVGNIAATTAVRTG